MKHIHKTIFITDDYYTSQYFSDGFVFFDIETTGLSSKTSFIYLIGLAVRENGRIHIHQFLAQNRSDETDLLAAFYAMLHPSDILVTFNGAGFDIPFINARSRSYSSLHNDLSSYEQIDLYRLSANYAHLFHLPDKKQKSIERFLGISREDQYTGKELISIYYEYEKEQKKEPETLLLLHNYEDVLGMTKLLSLFAYRDLFREPHKLVNSHLEMYHPYGSDTEETELLLELSVPVRFPSPFLYQGDLCSLHCKDSSVKLVIPVYTGILKFFYDNYKDYYYLPEEDTAIHKSVASFVDSSHRKKATAKTCYTKRSGTFLPQKDIWFTPVFSFERNARISFFELNDDFLGDHSALLQYADYLLSSCLQK